MRVDIVRRRFEVDTYVGVWKAERVLFIQQELERFARFEIARIYKQAILAHAQQ